MPKKPHALLGSYKIVHSPILRVDRFEFDSNHDPQLRTNAEIETGRDLAKPLEQLLCDVHEEALGNQKNQNEIDRIVGTNKRLASMMLAVVKSNDRVSRWLIVLTIVFGLAGLVSTVCDVKLAFFAH